MLAPKKFHPYYLVTVNDVGICQHFWPKFLKPCWQPKIFPMVPMLAPKNFLPFCLGHVNDVGICQHFSPKFLKPCWQPKNFPSWRPKFFPYYLVHVNDVGLCQHFWPKFLKPCWQPKKFPCWRPNVVICWHAPTFSRISINHVGSWKSWQFPPPKTWYFRKSRHRDYIWATKSSLNITVRLPELCVLILGLILRGSGDPFEQH